MLRLHRSERADVLVGALADVLAAPPPDPLTPDVVAVHSRGIERWLAQELSSRLGASAGRGDGVCANVAFPFPSKVVAQALAAAGDAVEPDRDPWAPQRLVWPLLALVETHADDDWLVPIRGHLRADGDDPAGSGRRFAAVRHIADLFDRYAVHRPAMLRRWADGQDQDGKGRALDPHDLWQARLWRAVRDHLHPIRSPADRLAAATAALRAGQPVPALPDRLCLFGLTALPASYVELFAALAATREVHVFLLHPSPALWDRVADVLPPPGAAPPTRDRDPTAELPRHPLLASWGRDTRELQLVVAPAAGSDAHHPMPSRQPARLLHHLQAAIRTDRPPADPRPSLDPDDRSVQLHACHGRTRQVEVLRDAVCHLLAADVSLEPRDIIVLCPDIEEFAPIVHAVFGAHVADADAEVQLDAGSGRDAAARIPPRPRPPDLRVRLADRALRETNPVLRVAAELLDLADGRVTASQVLDLAAREPVRRRFRLDDDDLSRLERWVSDAGIRWGLDGEHRARFDLAGITANTWRAGLDRLLLGVTMADEDARTVAGTVPLDDVEGADVDLAGRFAELVARLTAALTDLSAPRPIAGWVQALRDASDALTATGERLQWQRAQLVRVLDDVVADASATGAASDVALTLAEVRTLLDGRLAGRPTLANHRTGDLTVCTLVPMRSVPHRVVCLLGMDDGAFPRRTQPVGDDLTERDPRVGDRDPRTEDRQLLLDAVLAATDHLVVTYTGHDERTNEPRPPAVPIGELLDTIDRTVAGPGGKRARDAVVVAHPLQPFDPRNFAGGALLGHGPWSFDGTALAGARALVHARASGPHDVAFLDHPLPPPQGDSVALDLLVAFLEHPLRTFLQARLGVSLPRRSDEPDERIPVELAPLERWAVGDRLLGARLEGVDVDRWLTAERARGTLPPGDLADHALAPIRSEVEAIIGCVAEHVDPSATTTSLEVDVTLADGRALVGTVAGVVGDVLLQVSYSRVRAKQRLAAWARLLAATAAHPDRPLRAVTVGRCARAGPTVTVATLAPLAAGADERRTTALRELATLVDLFDRGLSAPLPLYCATSAAYAQAVLDDEDGVASAYREWTTRWRGGPPSEDQDPAHQLVLGGVVALSALLTDPPARDERGAGWPDEATRFGAYALRLWQPLRAREEVEDR